MLALHSKKLHFSSLQMICERNAMGLLLFLILGLIAGWLASVIMKNGDQGMLIDVVLGVVGAFLGGAIMNFFGQTGVTGFNIYSIMVATLGAIVLIGIGRAFNRS
jgi:uncharacterized membrane protein YeaQ/YmgE (transglycosylase-associated protein family)